MNNLACESDATTGAVAEAAEQRKLGELEDPFILTEASRANIVMAGVEAGPGMMRAIKSITRRESGQPRVARGDARPGLVAGRERQAEYATDAKRKISAAVHRCRWVSVQRLEERCQARR